MDFIIIIFIIFIGGGWLIGKSVGSFLFPKNNDFCADKTKHTTIINSYTTEQHLHISEEQLKKLKNEN